jgi:hypothetical protein
MFHPFEQRPRLSPHPPYKVPSSTSITDEWYGPE